MAQTISVGCDIGSQSVKIIVTESNDQHKSKPRIIGAGFSESKGVRHGYIVNIDEAALSIKRAVVEAEKSSGYKISKTYLAIGGVGLSGAVFSSSMLLSEKDSEVTQNDLKKIAEQCENDLPSSFLLNREIIHAIPLQYKLDGKLVMGRVLGMHGSKLEVRMLFITCLSQHVRDMIDALGACGIAVEDVMAAPLASSLATLSKNQQMAGCLLLNIGSETVSAAVFENGMPISIEVFPIGGNDITNDIALGLKIGLEDAERVKVSKPETVPYPRKKLEEIISARLSDIFELVEAHLKKIGRSGLLPAGVNMTGTSANISHLEEVAKSYLKLPAKKVGMKFDGDSKLPIRDGSWSTAYGLCVLGSTSNESESVISLYGMRNVMHSAKNSIWGWIKKILP
ncbi:MAG TPA: cell division protein FtsA [Candidatus Paceibacterota bacterium]|nr:cell division protein FtsA [Candidatus Paceibacterota bacterium]